MKLTGKEILRRIKTGAIRIDPFEPKHVNPNSVDLRLDRKLLVYLADPLVQRHPGSSSSPTRYVEEVRHVWDQERDLASRGNRFSRSNPYIELAEWYNVLDMAEKNETYELEIPDSGLVLVPGRLYLGQTLEYTETHDCVPCIEGRSSVGRLGINIHATAGFGDVGFCGTWTLEISVVEPVRVYPHVRFCQISYDTVVGEITKYNSEKYQGQRAPRPSGIWKELARSSDEEIRTGQAQEENA